MRGIYKIVNKINNKMYIGETLDILRRWEEHKESLKNNGHYNYKLQTDYNKYGLDNFEFSIILVLDESILIGRDKHILLVYESLYILKYDTINKGYNCELTVNEILNNNKIVYSKKDKYILKQFSEDIDEGRIKEYGGIVFMDIYMLKDIELELSMNKDILMNILMNTKVMINETGTRKFKLNESKFNEGVIANGSYFQIKFDLYLYNEILNIVKEHISKGNINIEKVSKRKKIDKPKIEELNSEVIINEINTSDYTFINEYESKNYKSFKEFLSNYQLNVVYNSIFTFLRNNKVLEYKYFGNKKHNIPCKDYINIISLCIHESGEGNKYIIMYLTKEGETFIYDLLKNNKLIE